MKCRVNSGEDDFVQSHPPCGGCGLKYKEGLVKDESVESPSMRRVWIEIKLNEKLNEKGEVTLHAEGVD